MALSNPVARVIAKAWTDPAFKQHLLQNPREALAAEGITVDPNVKIFVHENSDTQIHYVLPQGPGKTPLTERDIERAVIAGATKADGDCL